jgi:hypothetical protein
MRGSHWGAPLAIPKKSLGKRATEMSLLFRICTPVIPFLLASGLASASELNISMYDFDDTLISTTATIAIFKAGVDPKTAKDPDRLEISTADFAEVRHALGKPGQYEKFQVDPVLSFATTEPVQGRNNFLENIKSTLSTRKPEQWQAPKWREFEGKLRSLTTANEVYLLTARSFSRDQLLEGFSYLKQVGQILNLPPKENLFAAGNAQLRLSSDAKLDLSELPSETAKALIMKDLLDGLQRKALRTGQMARFAFFDDDYANFAGARDALVSEAGSRWPNVRIEIGYIGSKHPGTQPHSVIVHPAWHHEHAQKRRKIGA